MRFNNKMLLFFLSLTLLLTETLPQSHANLTQTEEHKEKPSLKKRIVLWTGSALGILAGVGLAAIIYTKVKSEKTSISLEQRQEQVETINTKDLANQFRSKENLEDLEALYKNVEQNYPKHLTSTVKMAYEGRKLALKQRDRHKKAMSQAEAILQATTTEHKEIHMWKQMVDDTTNAKTFNELLSKKALYEQNPDTKKIWEEKDFDRLVTNKMKIMERKLSSSLSDIIDNPKVTQEDLDNVMKNENYTYLLKKYPFLKEQYDRIYKRFTRGY